MKNYLESINKQFEYYKMLGEKTFEQIEEKELFWKYDEDSNSLAVIVNHLHGNMLSRWTDFFDSDGEKDWRNRDEEFEDNIHSKEQLLEKWNDGWNCLFSALNSITSDDLDRIIYIRNMGHSVTEAINRQLAHYSYHIGQIVFLGKMIRKQKWTSLSIPKGDSDKYNQEKFSKPKEKKHFTDDL